MRYPSPGRLEKDDQANVLLMIGTAGHVDHGKTRLIRLLTGCETDRLREEKERGLSIELGFAPCSLGKGISVGIVDVPGHEQFIKNMVAGAAGMDMTILVVAADDGVMPQTIEHLQIMEFLGVQKGMVVISKIDLVPEEKVEDVKSEIEILVEGTFLEGAPICPCSAETLDGFDDFYNALVKTALEAEIARKRGVFRMPVERVFSPPGHGTVVSGIPQSGAIEEGDEVEVQPSGARARVRGIQRFSHQAASGHAGQCLALNLAGLARDAVERGDVLSKPGYIRPGRFIQLRLTTTRDLNPPLKHNEEIKLHVGTAELSGRILLYEGNLVNRQQSTFGSVVLEQEAPASPTDRFVIRRSSPPVTVAGGVVLDVSTRKPRGSRGALAQRAKEEYSMFDYPESRFEYCFINAGSNGLHLTEATHQSLLELEEAKVIAEYLVAQGKLVPSGSGERYLHQEAVSKGKKNILCVLEKYQKEFPTNFGPTSAELAKETKIPDHSLSTLIDLLLQDVKVIRRDNRVSLPRQEERFQEREIRLLEKIEKIYKEGEFMTPRPDELPELTGAPAADTGRLLDYLCQKGTLVRLGKNVVFHESNLKEAKTRVVKEIREKGTLDSADFKAIINSSRKYALAILDHFDLIHVTVRTGNDRRLHPAYLRKMEE